MSNMFRLKSLVVGLGLAVGSLACAAAPAGTRVVAQAAALHAGDTVTGPMSLAAPMRVSVSLQLRNEAQLQAFIANPNHPNLTPAQFTAQYGPSEADANAVAAWLTQHGFSQVTISPNRLLVSATAPAAAVQSAFHTSMERVHTHDGRDAFANASDAVIPASLHGVSGVIGLQTVHVPHFIGRTQKGRPGGGGGGGSIIGHNPTQFPSIYGGTSLPTAAGVTVGIISNGDLTQTLSDLNTFTSQNGLAAVTTQIVNTGGTGTDTSGTPEWDLDSQDIVAMSGGVGKLIFYAANSLSNSDLTAAFNKAVSDNQAQVVNVSLGECETSAYQDGSMAADDQILALGVAQGQTFSISTGDSGSNECTKAPGGTTPSYPASSPYVIAVSGTSLSTGTSNSWVSETLWSKAGGSPSTVEPKPSWQTQGGGTTRDVADVAFDADPNSGAIIIVNGSNAQYGGTSLAAPLFAATWARMLAAHPTLGFAGPHLYTVSTASYHDVTSGSNGGETATVGWDYASGFGSGIVSALNAGL